MQIVSGKQACEIVSTGLGFVTGAIGTSGNPLGILAGSAAGYFFGRIICRIPALQRAFDNVLNGGDIQQLHSAISSKEIGAQAVALIESEGGLSKPRSEAVWSTIVSAVKKDGIAFMKDTNVAAARHHPPTGAAGHGISNLKRPAVV